MQFVDRKAGRPFASRDAMQSEARPTPCWPCSSVTGPPPHAGWQLHTGQPARRRPLPARGFACQLSVADSGRLSRRSSKSSLRLETRRSGLAVRTLLVNSPCWTFTVRIPGSVRADRGAAAATGAGTLSHRGPAAWSGKPAASQAGSSTRHSQALAWRARPTRSAARSTATGRPVQSSPVTCQPGPCAGVDRLAGGVEASLVPGAPGPGLPRGSAHEAPDRWRCAPATQLVTLPLAVPGRSISAGRRSRSSLDRALHGRLARATSASCARRRRASAMAFKPYCHRRRLGPPRVRSASAERPHARPAPFHGLRARLDLGQLALRLTQRASSRPRGTPIPRPRARATPQLQFQPGIAVKAQRSGFSLAGGQGSSTMVWLLRTRLHDALDQRFARIDGDRAMRDSGARGRSAPHRVGGQQRTHNAVPQTRTAGHVSWPRPPLVPSVDRQDSTG